MFSFLGFGSQDPPRSTKPSDDSPPAFPALDSIQRATSSSMTPSLQISPPDQPEEGEEEEEEPINFQLSDFDSLPPPISTLVKPRPPRQKVKLQPGFSQLDWAKLQTSGQNLRGEGIFEIRRITREELSLHNQKDDAWSSFQGKVYNLTPYLNYHPGGSRELMRVAGKDGTELFMKTHAWINPDGMMSACLVGFLVN